MLPVINPIIKVMIVVLAGSVVMTPTPQAGKHTNKIQKVIIEKSKEKRKEIDNPNYKPKKLPIIAGYKDGANPLPQGRTAKENYQEAWSLLKKELGW
jgi:hypothetical protein